jgi:hypothetical protein
MSFRADVLSAVRERFVVKTVATVMPLLLVAMSKMKDRHMSLNIEKAIFPLFNERRSLVVLAVGSALSLPSAWLSVHTANPPWVLVLALCTAMVLLGYMVRVQRAHFAWNGIYGLPSLRGNPADMIVSVLANVIGGVLLALFFGAIFLVLWALIALLFLAAASGSDFMYSDSDGWNYLLLSAVILWLPALVAVMLASVYAVMMQAHYAFTNRFAAVFEWRSLWSLTFRSFWRVIGITIVGGIIVALFNSGIVAVITAVGATGGAGLASEAIAALPLAFVSFASSVITANLFAQVYWDTRPPGVQQGW